MSGIIERYRSFFDIDAAFPVVTLHEGSTPLIPAPAVAAKTGVPGLQVFLKYEGLNPTGSFKDRGMTFAVSKAKAEGATHIICASTGNTSASAAAYGSRAGLETLIILPQGKVALGKLAQAVLYGARIIEITGNFDQALDMVRIIGKAPGVAIVNSINPYRIEGQKTGAYEICDQLAGKAPDYHFIPVGNAGNITAYWQGYKVYHAAGKIDRLPKMFGYEAEGAAAIVKGHKIDNPETLATAIRIGNPASWQGAEQARDESGGCIDAVTDDEIIAAYKLLAASEGIFCEKACAQNRVASNAVVTCVLTGNGLKDPDTAIRYGEASKVTLPADPKQIAAHLGLGLV
jgi:threonine synthase